MNMINHSSISFFQVYIMDSDWSFKIIIAINDLVLLIII
jgi:hypothetical protein